MGDLLEMIVASPVYSDSFTCTQALAIAEKSYLSLSAEMTGDNQ